LDIFRARNCLLIKRIENMKSSRLFAASKLCVLGIPRKWLEFAEKDAVVEPICSSIELD